jgi:hypothetical protein
MDGTPNIAGSRQSEAPTCLGNCDGKHLTTVAVNPSFGGDVYTFYVGGDRDN